MEGIKIVAIVIITTIITDIFMFKCFSTKMNSYLELLENRLDDKINLSEKVGLLIERPTKKDDKH